MSHMTCCDHFIGWRMFHGSHICFKVHTRVHIVSHDAIECGMMWKSIRLCLHGIHVCMGLTFTHDSLNCGFT